VRSAVRPVVAVIVGAAAVLWLGTASARSSQATLRSTSTSVTCPSVILIGQTGTCEAVVSDTDTGTATTPSGTVDFSASSTIEFSGTPVCTLSAAGSCQTTYTGSLGTATITASYDGDSSHATSSATQQIEVTACFGCGLRFCRVPRVTGKTVPQARRALRHFQCRSGRISHAFSKRIKKGRVISQKPGPHKVLLADNHRVRLVVSRGKRP
jgi:Bacterial Ig-like domain (group 3)/PASTA domain